MTSGAGRLLLLFVVLASEGVPPVLPFIGVPMSVVDAPVVERPPGVEKSWFAAERTSETYRSSSSTKLASAESGTSAFTAPGSIHLPVGSMVTCSTDLGVASRMPLAYLIWVSASTAETVLKT